MNVVISVARPVGVLFALLVITRSAAADEPWVRAEKVRCLSYLNASKQSVEFVPHVKDMGFNCALAMLGNAAVDTLIPVIDAADREKLHLIIVDYFDNRRYFEEPEGASARRYVGPDGRAASNVPCPADAEYWQVVLGKRAFEVARLCQAGHRSVVGLLLDVEDYAGTGDLPCGGTWYCYCDHCFGGFARSAGHGAVSMSRADRQEWLTANHLRARYAAYQDEEVVRILSAMRSELDAIDPEFLLATYPWPYADPAERDSRVPWDIRFARGLGTTRAPFMLFAESTYVWGYDPALERQQADLRAQGLSFVAVTGFNMVPSERVWWPEQMAASAYWATRRSDGYWIYVGDWPLLYAASGQGTFGLWGDRPEVWVKQFANLNRTLRTRKERPPALLPLPPLTDCRQLTDLRNPKHADGTEMYVRRWSDLGLPWAEGELVMIGRGPGDWLSFQCGVSRADRYEVSAWMTTGPNRAAARLYVDDRPAGPPVDLYQPITTPGERAVLGYADLSPGDHNFRLVAEKKNAAATGYEIGLRAAQFVRVGYPPEKMWIIGPFDNTGDDLPGFDAVYPPEQHINLDAVYEGKGGQPVRWSTVAVAPNGYLDLMPGFSEKKEVVAYCFFYLHSPTEGPRDLLLGSDDGGKLFVNGQMAWGEAARRSAVRDQNVLRVHLRQGWNEVLIKVLQASGQWGLYFRAYDPPHQIRYSLAPE
ncbi:MAG: hypothetical protein HY706_14260 [Candidatus Hydrogenedentes bacterium]|nr:hypothetical protein [Candidatus Hydrogenedentota bacterium]